LRWLELENTFRNFIGQSDGVPPSDLSRLESLNIHGRGFDEEEVEDLELARRDMSIFLGGLAKLKKLKIEFQYWDEITSFESLAATAGETLEKIRLRDTRYVSEGDNFIRSTSLSNLSILKNSFPQLTYLGLDAALKRPEVSLAL
jgi:hypothetical protein